MHTFIEMDLHMEIAFGVRNTSPILVTGYI